MAMGELFSARSWLFAPGPKTMTNATAGTARVALAEVQGIVGIFAATPGLCAIGSKRGMLDRPSIPQSQALLRQAGGA